MSVLSLEAEEGCEVRHSSMVREVPRRYADFRLESHGDNFCTSRRW